MLEELDKYSGLLTGISTLLLVIATWLLYKTSKKVPQISIYIKLEERYVNFIDLIIENIGDAPAYDVEIKVIDDMEIGNNVGTVKDLVFLERPKYFAPKHNIKSFLASYLSLKEKRNFCLEASYFERRRRWYNFKNIFRGKRKEKFPIDLAAWEKIHSLGEDPLEKISKNLDKIQQSFNKMLRSPFHAITQDYKEWKKETEKQRKKDLAEVRKLEKKLAASSAPRN